jgi:hypothetical protein
MSSKKGSIDYAIEQLRLLSIKPNVSPLDFGRMMESVGRAMSDMRQVQPGGGFCWDPQRVQKNGKSARQNLTEVYTGILRTLLMDDQYWILTTEGHCGDLWTVTYLKKDAPDLLFNLSIMRADPYINIYKIQEGDIIPFGSKEVRLSWHTTSGSHFDRGYLVGDTKGTFNYRLLGNYEVPNESPVLKHAINLKTAVKPFIKKHIIGEKAIEVPDIDFARVVYKETKDGTPVVVFKTLNDNFNVYTRGEIIDVYLIYHTQHPFSFDLFISECVQRLPSKRPVLCEMTYNEETEIMWGT